MGAAPCRRVMIPMAAHEYARRPFLGYRSTKFPATREANEKTKVNPMEAAKAYCSAEKPKAAVVDEKVRRVARCSHLPFIW